MATWLNNYLASELPGYLMSELVDELIGELAVLSTLARHGGETLAPSSPGYSYPAAKTHARRIWRWSRLFRANPPWYTWEMPNAWGFNKKWPPFCGLQGTHKKQPQPPSEVPTWTSSPPEHLFNGSPEFWGVPHEVFLYCP